MRDLHSDGIAARRMPQRGASRVNTGPRDCFPPEQLQFIRFNGASYGRFGEVIDAGLSRRAGPAALLRSAGECRTMPRCAVPTGAQGGNR